MKVLIMCLVRTQSQGKGSWRKPFSIRSWMWEGVWLRRWRKLTTQTRRFIMHCCVQCPPLVWEGHRQFLLCWSRVWELHWQIINEECVHSMIQTNNISTSGRRRGSWGLLHGGNILNRAWKDENSFLKLISRGERRSVGYLGNGLF